MNLVVFDKETGQINLAADVSGPAIWAVGEWLEAHYDGTPYELFRLGRDYGYRLTVERIPEWVDPQQDEDMQWPRSEEF